MKLKSWLIVFLLFAVLLGISIGYFLQKWKPGDYTTIVAILWFIIILTTFVHRGKLKKIEDLLDK